MHLEHEQIRAKVPEGGLNAFAILSDSDDEDEDDDKNRSTNDLVDDAIMILIVQKIKFLNHHSRFLRKRRRKVRVKSDN